MSLWNKISSFLAGFQQGSLHLPFVRPEEDKDVLIIDRKTWSRGRPSTLLSESGSRCCLGFYSKFLGVPDDQMMGVGNPCLLPYGGSGWQTIKASWLSDQTERKYELWTSSDNILLVRYNDYERGKRSYEKEEVMTEELREQKIAEVFKRNGVRVVFEN
jgi:hypothetical protein